jgi:hypothetical protein
MTMSAVPAITACAGRDDRLLAGSALPVDGHAGHVLGQARDQRHRPRDISGLRADRVDAAVDDVIDGARIDFGPLDQRPDRVRAQVRRVDPGQPAASAPDRCPDRVDDVRLAHRVLPCPYVPGQLKTKTTERAGVQRPDN